MRSQAKIGRRSKADQNPGCGRLYRDGLSRRQTPPNEFVNEFQPRRGTQGRLRRYRPDIGIMEELIMSLGKGALLWLLGIPLPIILLLVLFWR